MTFILHRKVGKATVLNDVRSNLLRVGRGTNAELRSENPAVALEHAIVEESSQGYTLVDRGSITGTYLNGKPVETARLSKGDVIDIGDIRIKVQVAEPGKPLFLKVEELVVEAESRAVETAEAPAGIPVAGEGPQLKAPKIDYVSAYQLRRPLISKTIFATLAVLLASGALIAVVRDRKTTAFMPGGVSSAHARVLTASGKSIGSDCGACHDAWNGVVDNKCTSCHSSMPHAAQQASTPPCISCHTEHRDFARLSTVVKDTSCSKCHADLKTNASSGRTVFAHQVTSFGDNHPEFGLAVARDGGSTRLPLSDAAAKQSDPAVLGFNHKYHLQKDGVLTASGVREKLNCESCHRMQSVNGKSDPTPIRFESHCQRCHQLTFDPRFPSAQVPHGEDPGIVYGSILATYAGNRNVIGKSPGEVRRILSARSAVSADDRAVLNAEQVVKTKCSLCHELVRKDGRLGVTQPGIRKSWFEHAHFSHSPHLNVSCETCHASARQSSETSDVIMPGRASCTGCHGAAATEELLGKGVSSSCTTCHYYHPGSKNQIADADRMTEGRRDSIANRWNVLPQRLKVTTAAHTGSPNPPDLPH
ncbi:MAG TPA: FHA domain-containing protein [Thermoanaerobaculia bacterium]|nr:FHA domain-containing protein [Thermoanaerobaculia bacterium]